LTLLQFCLRHQSQKLIVHAHMIYHIRQLEDCMMVKV